MTTFTRSLLASVSVVALTLAPLAANAQATRGGNGGQGNDPSSAPLGGLSSMTGTGGAGQIVAETYEGGAGGGAGVIGGAGGNAFNGNLGGAGGATAGASGGNGVDGIGFGGRASGAGGGAHGALLSNTTTPATPVTGGNGGLGGTSSDGDGGGGGAGGYGVVADASGTFVFNNSIAGGTGGNGGGGWFFGGSGGDGGHGLAFTGGATATVNNQVNGGDGGAGGAFLSGSCCSNGANGAGGTGITGGGLALTINAAVSGGLYGDGVTRADALSFTSGINSLTLGASGSLTGGIAVASGANLDFAQSTAAVLSNGISGAGSISKSGTGTLTLSGVNTYGGGTTLTAGTVVAGSNAALGTGTLILNGGTLGATGPINLANAIAINTTGGAIQADNGVILTLSGNIQNGNGVSGTVTVASTAGSAIVILAGTSNSYSGATIVGDGVNQMVLQGAFSANSAITVTAGSILDLSGADRTIASLAGAGEVQGSGGGVQGLTTGGDNSSTTFSGVISNGVGTLALTKAGTGTMTLSGVNTYGGGTTINGGLINFADGDNLGSGNITLDGGGLQWAAGTTTDISGRLNALGAGGGIFDTNGNNVTLASAISGSGGITKEGTGTLTLSAVSIFAGDIAINAGVLAIDTASTPASLDGVISGNGVLVKDGTGTLTLTGVNTYGGGTIVAGGTLRLENSAAAGTGAITTTGSVIDYANGVDIANDILISSDTTQLNVSSGATATQTGQVLEDASARPVEKTGTGTLIVASAANTGMTTISEGAWKAASAVSFSAGSDHVVASGAILDMNGGDQIVSSLAGAGTVTSSAASDVTLIVGNFGTGNIGTTFSGVIENGDGTVGLTVDGVNGPFILTGANTYTGDTLICDCSSLQIGDGGTTGSITSNVINNNALIFNRSNDYDFGYTISDGFGAPGGVAQVGGGILTLSGVNTYSGGTRIDTGTIRIADDFNLGDASGRVTFANGGTLLFSGDAVLDPARAITLAAGGGKMDTGGHAIGIDGDIDGIDGLTIGGGGTLALGGVNSYAGGTTVNGAVLAIRDDINLGDTGGALTLDGGTLRVDGAGLALDASREVNLRAGGGTLDANGNGLQVSGDIHGTGRLSLIGGGFTASGGILGGGFSSAVFLLGLNDYSGGTRISDTLAVALDSESLGAATGGITLEDQGGIIFFGPTTLESTRTITLAGTGGNIISLDLLQIDSRITGSGGLALIAGDDLTLGGINDYTGGTLLLGGGAGKFFISDDRNLGAASGALEMNGAILGFGANVTMASRAITLSGLGGVFDTDSHTVTILQAVSGTGDLVQFGSGTLVLAGDNTHVGDTFIDGGTLVLGNGGVSGSLAADPGDMIFNGGTLVFNSSGTHTVSQDITDFLGAGALRQRGSGTTILTGNNDYSGGTWIERGTLQVGDGGTAGTLVPGAIVNDGILSFKRSDAVTLTDVVSGAGAVRQDGTGTLTLTAASAFTGGLTINAGRLALTGAGNVAALPLTANGTFDFSAMSGSGVTVTSLNGTGIVALGSKSLTIGNGGSFSGGFTGTGPVALMGGVFSFNGTAANVFNLNGTATLKGRGTVGGIVSAGGTMVAPGNSIGTLNVTGNVSFAAGSTYQVEVDNTGASDRIAATGTATLNGGTVDVQEAAGTYGVSTTYTILTASGGVTGAFTNATSNFLFLRPTLNYSANAVTLTLSQPSGPVSPDGPPPPTFPGVAQIFNQKASAGALQSGGAAGGSVFLAVLNSVSAVSARAAFDAISGEIHATLLASQQEAASAMRRVVLERMRHAGDSEAGWSVWGSISGDWSAVDGDGNAAGAKRSGVGIAIGADTRLDGNWRGGFEGGYSSGKLNVAARNSAADVQSGHVGVYAHGRYDAVKLRVGGAYGFGTADTQRAVIFTSFSDLASARQDADTMQVFGEAGYQFDLGGVSLEPFAGLSWTQVSMGAFRESGGSAVLAGASRILDDGAMTLGAQVEAAPFHMGAAALTPSLRAGWQHGFSNGPASRSLSFVSTGQDFTVLGTPLDADRAVIDAGANVSLGDSVNLFLGYSGTLSSRAHAHGVRITAGITL